MRKITFLITLRWGSKSGLGEPVLKCVDPASICVGSEVEIEWALITPANRKMPPERNHCFDMVGDGGTAGTISAEKGTAPEKLIGSRVEEGKARRTRPLFPYPEVAWYKDTGSIAAR